MTTNKIIFIFALLFLSPTLGGGELLAQTNAPLTEYKLLEPLPGITSDSAGTKTNANIYIAGLFNLTLALAVVFAVLRLIYAGITYMSSDAFGKKGAAKAIIEQTLWGLALAISAWVIVAAVIKPQEPGAFVFDLSLDAIPLPKDNNLPIPGGTSGTGACSGCVSLSSLGLPTSGSATGKSIASSFGSKLSALNSSLGGEGVRWAITEAYPPSIAHRSGCHSTGMCIDAKLSNPTARNINTFASVAAKHGLSATYEVLSNSIRDAWIRDGVNASIIKVNPSATGPHFHIR